MRLICPNCNAQYEVDDQVIPKAGRDVQCSACTHTWFQYPLDVTLRMRAADVDDDDDDSPDAPPTDGAGHRPPRIDKSVLNVLREEAEREIEERKRRRNALETQGDLGLTAPEKISRAGGTRYFGEEGEAPAPPPVPTDVDDDDAGTTRKNRRGRSVLPDIDELSSTLEPDTRAAEEDYLTDTKETPERQPGGFQNGLTVVMMVGVGLIVLYILAPVIVANVPALDSPLRAYVGFIDGIRRFLAESLRGLLGAG